MCVCVFDRRTATGGHSTVRKCVSVWERFVITLWFSPVPPLILISNAVSKKF